MNSSLEILHSQGITPSKDTIINNIDWRTQDSNINSILFYRFNKKSEDEITKFKNRLNNVEFAVCIVNLVDAEDTSKSIFAVSDKAFLDLQINLLHHIYPVDYEKFKLVGVTGTNGKTTTVDLLRQLAVQQKKNVLTIGTLGVFYNNNCVKNFSLTTPAYIDMHKVIAEYCENVDIIAMEMSSHALDQKRFGALSFDSVGWTNLTQDHLDYHQSMEEYFQAKMKIFEYLNNEKQFYIAKSQQKLKEMINRPMNEVEWNEKTDNLFLKPQYNRDNLALAIHLLEGIIENSKIDYSSLIAPPGRFNIIEYKNNYIVIDFAHSPDGLRSIGHELRETFKDKNIITIFGCGGDRDRSKRPLMGQAVSEFSDSAIITSDNPRFEDPKSIIDDIIPGMSVEYDIVIDRSEAIKKAFQKLSNSVLLIAGKGHEEYIDQNGTKKPYSDLKQVEQNIHD